VPGAESDGIAHSACQEGRRYRLRRRAIDSAPVSSLVTGKASRSYELGTPHSITSSARASSVGGTVRPSALAAVIRRSCYNKAHDLEHGFHTPALLGES
jgi:hypothetical protein